MKIITKIEKPETAKHIETILELADEEGTR